MSLFLAAGVDLVPHYLTPLDDSFSLVGGPAAPAPVGRWSVDTGHNNRDWNKVGF